ncbi:MAG: CBS domain-containing protein [Elusimicrobia bacterium]|nr:CBS domain-containing protein [Elusimicrobiota bacterium]
MHKPKVKDIMTEDPACCTPETRLQDVARMMVEEDCGEIPVVESEQSKKPVGVITDRDIVCRAVAQGKNPLELTAKDCMSSPCVTVKTETSLADCCKTMEDNRIRRVPVIDEGGDCRGIVSQADIAIKGEPRTAAEVVKKVSEVARV